MDKPMDLSDAAIRMHADTLAVASRRWSAERLRDEIAAFFTAIRDAATAAEREKQRVLLEYLETAGPRRVIDNAELCMLCEGKPHSADCEIGNALAALRGGDHD